MKRLNLLLGAMLLAALPAGATFADAGPKTAAPAVLRYQVTGPSSVPDPTATGTSGTSGTAAPGTVSGTTTTFTPTGQPVVTPQIVMPPNTCGPALPNVGDGSGNNGNANSGPTATPAASGPPATAVDPQDPEGGAASDTPPQAAPATPPPPQIQPAVKMSCADDNVVVQVAARAYEYHFGDNVTIEMTIAVADQVKIDLNPLVKQGRLYMTNSGPWELVSRPMMEYKKIEGGTMYHIIMVVRQFAPGPYSTFTIQIPYATSAAPNGTPLWMPLQTPAFNLMQDVNGLPGMAQPTFGNTGTTQPRASWAMAPSVVLVSLLLLIWPLVALMRYVNRVRPRQKMPRQVEAWLALNRAIASGKEMGFSPTHYARMSQIIRRYLEPSYPGISSMPVSAIANAFDKDGEAAGTVKTAVTALGTLERVIVEQQTLTDDEHKRLLSQVDKLIPRPLSL